MATITAPTPIGEGEIPHFILILNGRLTKFLSYLASRTSALDLQSNFDYYFSFFQKREKLNQFMLFQGLE